MGVFASVLAATIDDGQVAASWQEAGADYRIDALPDGSLGAEVDPATVPGVEAVAAALTETTNPVRGEVGRPGSLSLIAVDPGAHEAVLAGSPVAVQFPAPIHDAQGQTGSGSGDRPIPVLVSRRLPNGWQPLSIGEVFRLGVGEQPLTLSVVGFLDDFPGVPRGTPFVIAPIDPVVDVLGARRPAADRTVRARPRRHRREPARCDERSPSVGAVASRHEQLAAERSAPLVAAVGQGFVVALGAAAVYAVLAVVAVVALETRRRARELAYLRTLGLSEGQGIALAFVEHAPPALLALGDRHPARAWSGVVARTRSGSGCVHRSRHARPATGRVDGGGGDGPVDADRRRDPGRAERMAGPSTRPGPGPADRRMRRAMTTEAP